MWAPLGTLVIRYRTGLAACQRPFAGCCALIVTTLAVVHPMTAAAQRVDGAIGVSLTIVAPRPARNMEITGVRIDRDGMATIRTTSAAPRITGIVMARVSGADVLDAGGHGHALPCESLRDECERKMECRVDVGRPDAGVARDVRLRMELLVVAGT